MSQAATEVFNNPDLAKLIYTYDSTYKDNFLNVLQEFEDITGDIICKYKYRYYPSDDSDNEYVYRDIYPSDDNSDDDIVEEDYEDDVSPHFMVEIDSEDDEEDFIIKNIYNCKDFFHLFQLCPSLISYYSCKDYYEEKRDEYYERIQELDNAIREWREELWEEFNDGF